MNLSDIKGQDELEQEIASEFLRIKELYKRPKFNEKMINFLLNGLIFAAIGTMVTILLVQNFSIFKGLK